MKFVILALALLVTANAFALSKDRGGGDICEDRIKVIRDDIQSWISNGGSSALNLPTGIGLQTYNQQMLSQIAQSKIRCVGDGDDGYPVQIGGTPKVCRFDKRSSSSRVTCDFTKFQSMSEADQYVLIHHEYAGLAGIETPDADDSHYDVSNQISENLADQIVKKLVVRASQAAMGWVSVVDVKSLTERISNLLLFNCKFGAWTILKGDVYWNGQYEQMEAQYAFLIPLATQAYTRTFKGVTQIKFLIHQGDVDNETTFTLSPDQQQLTSMSDIRTVTIITKSVLNPDDVTSLKTNIDSLIVPIFKK